MGTGTSSGRSSADRSVTPSAPVNTGGKIYADRVYSVEKFTESGNGDRNYGALPGSDVKSMLRGYTYNQDLDMWFTKSGRTGYSITEVRRGR